MKISPTVLKLMLAGTSGLGLAVGAASAMTPAADAQITVFDNAVTENSVTPVATEVAPTVPLELVPPESLTAPVELGARVEVIDNSVTPEKAETAPVKTEVEATEAAPYNGPAIPQTAEETAPVPAPTASPTPTATPTPTPDSPFGDPCLGCGMG